MNYYILKNKIPVKCDNDRDFLEFYDDDNRIIDCTIINDIKISTVFLGIDHNFSGDKSPTLFETMVFWKYDESYQVRSKTYEESETEHKKAIEYVEKYLEEIKSFEHSLK